MNKRMNKKYIKALKSEFGDTPFSTHQAELLYHLKHAEDAGTTKINSWAAMQARDNLVVAAQQGVLHRIDRGMYRFTPEDNRGPGALAIDLANAKVKIASLEWANHMLQLNRDRCTCTVASTRAAGRELAETKERLRIANLRIAMFERRQGAAEEPPAGDRFSLIELE